ncbi:MAG: hypothetical protein HY026_10580 [Deltaproteobacteria bacterium]|nr:hypothetical protein [Deltaproteobacteria bacterium]
MIIIPHISLSEIGVIVNDTHTPIGSEFYRIFTQYWENDEEYNVVITEESGQWGSIVQVVVDGNVVYATPRLNYAEMEEQVRNGIDNVVRFIVIKRKF